MPPLLCATSLGKSFGGIPVLTDASVELHAGEVHAFVGENGAGKSTLAKLLAGVYPPTTGRIEFDGAPVVLESPGDAIARGIALIHQEPLTFPELSVAENLFAGRLPVRGGRIDWRTMNDEAARWLETLGAALDPRLRVGGLSIADQQMIEIAAALSQNARVLILDETTAALTPAEVERLFGIVRRLRGDGKAIALIGHRLEEIFALSDRVTVLRDGRIVGQRAVAATSREEILRLMVGRDVAETVRGAAPAATTGAPALEARGLTRAPRFADLSFAVRPGEIVGLAGLVGAGRTEVVRALFGLDPLDEGTVLLDGQPVTIRSPEEAMRHGIALVPEDRQHQGILAPLSLTENATLPSLPALSWRGWVRDRDARAATESWIERLAIRCRDAAQPIRELSGGNQQKVVLARWLQKDPTVLLLDEPTRGVDVGAKARIHAEILERAAAGMAVVLVSSDLPEVLALADRVLVMRQGRIVAEQSRAEATPESVIAAASGPAETTLPHRTTSARSGKRKGGRRRELSLALALLAVAAGATALQPQFASVTNLRSLLLWVPLLTVAGMGQSLAILTRGIDVSVGSTLGLAGMATALLLRDHPGLDVFLAALIGTGLGAGLGAVNGGLIAYARIPAIVATLGTMGIYRGLTFSLSGGRQVDDYELPRALAKWSLEGPFGQTLVPWVVLAAVAVAALAHGLLSASRFGRALFALGGNPDAAALRGIPAPRTAFFAYLLCGAGAGLAGVLYASRFGTVNPASIGAGFELLVIAASVIGGVSVFGGVGSAPGVLLGCLLLGAVNVALTVLAIADTWQTAIYGLVLLAAVLADERLGERLGLRRRRGGA